MEWIDEGIAALDRIEATLPNAFAALSDAAASTVEDLQAFRRQPGTPDLGFSTDDFWSHLDAIDASRDSLRATLTGALGHTRAWFEKLHRLSNPPSLAVTPVDGHASSVGPTKTASTTSPTTTETIRDADAFLAAATPLFEADPVLTTRVNSMAQSHAAAPAGSHDNVGIVIRGADGTPLSVAMVPATRTLDVLPTPPQAIPGLVAELAAQRPDLRGVRGDVETTTRFAEQWCEHTGATSTITAHKCIHRLHTPFVPPNVPGALRLATLDDVDVVHAWSQAFAQEAVAGDPAPSPEAIAKRIESGLAWVWVDTVEGQEHPVSYIGASPLAFGVHRLGPAYTPSSRRSMGYAGGAAGGVARELAARPEVAEVVFFTDLANDTSTMGAWGLGFRPAYGTIEIAFR